MLVAAHGLVIIRCNGREAQNVLTLHNYLKLFFVGVACRNKGEIRLRPSSSQHSANSSEVFFFMLVAAHRHVIIRCKRRGAQHVLTLHDYLKLFFV